MNICVVIPAYNESKNIAAVLSDLQKLKLHTVVIDDGSTDNTLSIAQNSGAIVLKNAKNCGKGFSLRKGFDYASAHKFDAVITLDADGQHLVSDIPAFIECAQKTNAGIIIGNRMTKTQRMPTIRLITNKFMSWVISHLAKQHIPDSQCGFRLIRNNVFGLVSFKTMHYETESELLLKAAAKKVEIKSIPIATVYTNQKSEIHPIRDTLRFFAFIRHYL